jgi:GntR family transcriptional repressor for pyruvate dehydrogenase complex
MIESRGTGISRRNLSQAVTEELLRLIGTGEIRAGERLPTERGLMERFQVGRNTVREAVHALASQGLVDVRPGRGAVVLSLSANQALDNAVVAALLDDQAVSDLYEFRKLIEVEVAGRAASHASERDLEDIGRDLKTYLHAYHERLPTWSEDVALHRAVAVASHNVIYLDVLDLVNDKLLATRKETQRHATVLALAAREHAAIFDAIKAHDTEQARAAMAQHIDSAIWALDQARKRLHQGTGSAFPLEAGSSDSPVGGGGSGASPINGA